MMIVIVSLDHSPIPFPCETHQEVCSVHGLASNVIKTVLGETAEQKTNPIVKSNASRCIEGW